ncbi:MAG: UDP-N-acetylmuramoyl-L-alanyl-D-glutamate--2,6-diaminopimelate ligase [Bacillota bacterium]
MFKIGEIRSFLPHAKLLSGSWETTVVDLQFDSRQVNEGSLFVCISGALSDGHYFASEAVKRKAKALVVEHPIEAFNGVTVVEVPDTRKALALLAAYYFDYPSRKFSLIGITGTNGKTSTTNLLEAIFLEWGKKTALTGTIVNRIGSRVLPATHTTPESLNLQRLFKTMVEDKVDYVMMEVSSHALVLNRVEEAEFDVAVFTNLTRDHLDFHGDFDSYKKAKGKLFSQLGTGVKKRFKYAIVNNDDGQSAYFKSLSPVPVFTYSIDKPSDFQAVDLQITAEGASFRLKNMPNFHIKLNLTGRFSIYNALAAIAVAFKEEVPMETIALALKQLPGVPGRFEALQEGRDYTIIVDYAHTPDGLENVLKTAREICKEKIITVFGCGGDRDRSKRPLMGEVSGSLSNYTILTSDNPRTEDPDLIIDEIKVGLLRAGGSFEIVRNRKKAIERAISLANAGDLVLIAGKGHEDYQIIGDKKYPFDDREVVRRLLKKD